MEDHRAAALLGPFARSGKMKVDEGEVVARLMDPVGRRGVMLDIGAHRGHSATRFVEAGWRVVACEPDPENRAALEQTFAGAGDVSIDRRAVSDARARAVPFYSSRESAAISSLHAFHRTHEPTQSVDVITVADLVDEYGVDEVGFLKIDAEGLDWQVLQGVPWDRIRPEVIECEFEDAKTSSLGHTYEDMADGLVARGYTVYLSEWHPIVRYGGRHDWRQVSRYPAPLGSDDAWGNLIAFREDPGPRAVKDAFVASIQSSGRRRARKRAAAATSGSDPSRYTGRLVRNPRGSLGRFSTRLRGRLRANVSHPVLVVGRLVMWIARTARSHPGPALGLLVVFGILIAAGFIPELDPFGKIAWVLAAGMLLAGALVVSAGFANFLVGELRTRTDLRHQTFLRTSKRHEDHLEELDAAHAGEENHAEEIGERLARLESMLDMDLPAKLAEIAAQHKSATRALERTVGEIAARRDTDVGALEARIGEIAARKDADLEALEARIGEVASRQDADVESLEARLGEVASLRAAIEAVEAQLGDAAGQRRAGTEALEAKLGEIAGQHRAGTEALEAKLGEIAAERDSALESLEARLGEVASLRAAIEAVEAQLGDAAGQHRAGTEALEAKLAEIAAQRRTDVDMLGAKLGEVDAQSTAQTARIEASLGELDAQHGARLEALSATVRELVDGQRSDAESVGQRLEKIATEQTARADAVEERLDRVSSTVKDAAARDVSLEIASTLRQIHLLWDQRAATRTTPITVGVEHGHALLMARLIDEERRSPGILRGRTLIEVGSTRERTPDQGSTEKLAIFSAFTGMRFITIDMDPQNTDRVKHVVRHLNPEAEAVNARGELFLAEWEEPLDYVYLDAFDFHHDEHSPERQESYRKYLGTEINDEECWQMHQACAAAIVTKMPAGGIVVIDDTWQDDQGAYGGKGKLAVPLLLASGFEEIAGTSEAVALRRGSREPAEGSADAAAREPEELRGTG